jgi:hypothetical protein
MARPRAYDYSNDQAEQEADARDALGQSFLKALTADYAQHGPRALKKLRRKRPQDYLKLTAAFLPKKFRANRLVLDEITDEEFFKVLAVVREAIAEKEREEAERAGRTIAVDVMP